MGLVTVLGIPLGLPIIALFLVVFLVIGRLLYNLFLHPLRSYPGPWFARASIFWFLYHSYVGDYPFAVHNLHLKYGPIIRIAPNELAFTDPQAWKDIYGHRHGTPENIKDPSQTFGEDPHHPSIIAAGRDQHSKLRKLLSNAFSDKAMREQEPILKSYVNLLMAGLHKNCAEPVNLVRWYNFCTFDVIGHLAFAEPFDCLSTSDYHPWVQMIFSTIKFITWIRAFERLAPGISNFLIGLIPKRIVQEKRDSFDLTTQKLHRRKERRPEYTDFMTHLIAAEEKGLISFEDIKANAPVFVVAGSETTATLLSGATYYMLKDPRVYALVANEVRSSFSDESEITLARVSELKYLLAMLDEVFRLYPPGANNHPRLTPPQGATIAGHFIPGNCMVGINQYAMFRYPDNFVDSEAFVPERVLQDDPKWANDKRDALQPFSFGPRNCIGRNLAYSEMRLIMAYLLLNFDLELMPESENWLHQKIFTTWEKNELKVRLIPRVRNAA